VTLVTSAAPLLAVEATSAHGEALAELFARAEVPCHCRYWHFTGTTNEWLDRSRHDVARNRSEMLAALASGSPEMSGVVALAGDPGESPAGDTTAVGWLKLAPAASVPKLYAQRLYRRLPCFDGPREGVFALGCFLVDPERRRTGVAEALLARSIPLAREKGGRAIEAFPRRAEAISDAEAWNGPFSLLRRAGFDIVHDFAPYPVLRLTL
jgi:GNAT superfamily N-acetyltransferase